jgi:hypothetical protein
MSSTVSTSATKFLYVTIFNVLTQTTHKVPRDIANMASTIRSLVH